MTWSNSGPAVGAGVEVGVERPQRDLDALDLQREAEAGQAGDHACPEGQVGDAAGQHDVDDVVGVGGDAQGAELRDRRLVDRRAGTGRRHRGRQRDRRGLRAGRAILATRASRPAGRACGPPAAGAPGPADRPGARTRRSSRRWPAASGSCERRAAARSRGVRCGSRGRGRRAARSRRRLRSTTKAPPGPRLTSIGPSGPASMRTICHGQHRVEAGLPHR